ncbi:hypothetical protein [Streptomonospora alba]|uniref:hypothetical protein n=1 Tax=Streptomonospora alba TaxID=183763 RepID=UPI0012EE512C|nr:hypothetical protein [Streptomonospora alba]
MTPAHDVGRFPHLLRRRLGPRWDIAADGPRIRVEHADRASPYRPPRRHPTWDELLATIEDAFVRQGVARDRCLPLRWGRETDLTISAVQALDPLLKDGTTRTYRQGFIPQPVVRFTARRDAAGELRDGFTTSFINVSRVEPITDITAYIDAIDGWISVLSAIGLHARHISILGDLTVWRRGAVCGTTLRFQHVGETIGDIVLLWNADEPTRAAIDLGSGLERLAWARSHLPWTQLIYGGFADSAPSGVLDALRTATLLLGHGISPTSRGAGAATRRVLATIPRETASPGVSSVVRHFHGYWNAAAPLPAAWPEITHQIEQDRLAKSRRGKWAA